MTKKLRAVKVKKATPVVKVKKVAESGHGKNVDNFGKLITLAESLGTDYKPANTKLSVLSLNTMYSECKTDKQLVIDSITPYKTMIGTRSVDFATVPPLSTRILGATKSLELPPESIQEVKAFVRKIRGGRAVALPKVVTATTDNTTVSEEGTDLKTHSVSQTSFTNIVDHMNGIKSVLVGDVLLYIPNETDLTTASVSTLIDKLALDNKGCDTAFYTLNNARTKRNKGLYTDKSGMLSVAAAVKEYFKSAYGATSSQYRQITKITFKDCSKEL